MTQEDKELLLKDLCARLPYGVKVSVITLPVFRLPHWRLEDDLKETRKLNPSILCANGVEYIKPYLRPISSMTEEEKKEEDNTVMKFLQDFYNGHHLDYRGLIEKGLALEAPEGMYKQ